MIRRTIAVAALLAVTAVAGCKEEENQTVQHFTDNPEERAEVLKDCEVTDAAQLEANCVNADEAEAASQRERDRKGFSNVFGEPSFK